MSDDEAAAALAELREWRRLGGPKAIAARRGLSPSALFQMERGVIYRPRREPADIEALAAEFESQQEAPS